MNRSTRHFALAGNRRVWVAGFGIFRNSPPSHLLQGDEVLPSTDWWSRFPSSNVSTIHGQFLPLAAFLPGSGCKTSKDRAGCSPSATSSEHLTQYFASPRCRDRALG